MVTDLHSKFDEEERKAELVKEALYASAKPLSRRGVNFFVGAFWDTELVDEEGDNFSATAYVTNKGGLTSKQIDSILLMLNRAYGEGFRYEPQTERDEYGSGSN